MKFKQGAAPAVLFSGGEIIFEFMAGCIETDDAATIEKLIEAGAVTTEAGIIQGEKDIKYPKDCAGMSIEIDEAIKEPKRNKWPK